MSIPIDPARAVGGRLGAGDRVDVLFAGTAPGLDHRRRRGGARRRRAWSRRDRRVGEPVHGDGRGLGRAVATRSRPPSPTATSRSPARRVPVPRPAPRRSRSIASGRPTPSTRRRGDRSWNRPSRWCSRPNRGSRSCIATSPHHGGARVRQIVVEPAVALDEEYDALVVSDRWPALDARLRARGPRPWSAGPRRLRSRGTGGQGSSPRPRRRRHDRRATRRWRSSSTRSPTSTSRRPARSVPAPTPLPTRAPRATGVWGRWSWSPARRGSGVTEVAVTLAAALAARREPVVLVDAHEVAPSVAGRLGLELEPNLRSAIDACAHGLGELPATITWPPGGAAALGVVAGFPSPVAATQVTPDDVLDVVDAVRERHACVVDADETSPVASVRARRRDGHRRCGGCEPRGGRARARVGRARAPPRARHAGPPGGRTAHPAPATAVRRSGPRSCGRSARSRSPGSRPTAWVEAAAWDGALPWAADRSAAAVALARADEVDVAGRRRPGRGRKA